MPFIRDTSSSSSSSSSSPERRNDRADGTHIVCDDLEPIAVVGMDVAYPAIVPSSRFNIDSHLHPINDRPGSFNVLGGYFLQSDLKDFDPALFGISPVEAMWMDPQQRQLLEICYGALESRGQTLQSINGSNTACFAGSFTAEFQQMSFKERDFRHS
ncbi:MAG: hypothetical protein Q9221_007440 [Calogaya cf. arnoldii]